MLLDFLFRVWRRLNGPLQWWSLWLVNSKFMLSVSGVVRDPDGAILLLRHRHWVADVWGLPGGIVHHGERLEDAFAREIFEETGLVISDIRLLRVNSGYRLRVETYFQARCERPVQPLRLQKQEVLEARFFPPGFFPANMLASQRQIIEGAERVDKE